MEASWIATQKKAFSRWSNHVLQQRGLAIHDIDNDLRTGSLLISLVEILSSEALSPRKLSSSSSTLNVESNKIQSFTNATKALKFMETQGINVVNCRPDHIVDNNSKMVLGLLWRVITHYHIQPLIADDDMLPDTTSPTLDGTKSLRASRALLNKSTRDALLRWCKNELDAYNINPPNFTKGFQTPAVLAGLVHRQKPEIIDLAEIEKMDAPAAFAKIFTLAETHLGIPQILDPSDFLDPSGTDECSVMTYIAYFLKRTAAPVARSVPATPARGRSQTDLVASRGLHLNLNDVPTEGSDELANENAKLRSENRLLKEFIKTELEKVARTLEQNMQQTNQKVEERSAQVTSKAISLRVSLDRLAATTAALSAENKRLNAQLIARDRRDSTSSSTSDKDKERPVLHDVDELKILKAKAAKAKQFHAQMKELELANMLQAEEMKGLKAEAALVAQLRAQVQKMEAVHAESMMMQLKNVALKQDYEKLQGENQFLQNQLVANTSLSPPSMNHNHLEHSAPKRKSLQVDSPDSNKSTSKPEPRSSTPPVEIISAEIDVPILTNLTSKPLSRPSSALKIATTLSKRRLLKSTLTGEELRIHNITIVQSLVRRWLAKRARKRAMRRKTVAAEIVNTEKTYVGCLQVLLSEYFQPLRKMAAEGQPLSNTLNENLLKTIFNNAEVISNINSNLLAKLEQRWLTWNTETKLGDVFLSTMEFLKCYNQYVNHYNRSLDTLAECGKITAFMDFLKVKALKCGHHLRDLLIVPVQRIPRYVILLEEMVRYTEKTHPDYRELTLALSKMHRIADYVNEKKRDFEALAQVSSIQESLIGISILEYPRLRFLLEGDQMIEDNKKQPRPYHVFLFNEIILCTKAVKKVFGDRKQKQATKYKFSELIKLSPDTKVSKATEGLGFVIEIPNTVPKKFCTTTEKERDQWSSQIQASVDKMIEAKRTKSNSIISLNV